MFDQSFTYHIAILVKTEKIFIHQFECDMVWDLNYEGPTDEFEQMLDTQVKFEIEGSFGLTEFEYECINIHQIEN